MNEYSQGVAGDGPCILFLGDPLTPEEIVFRLNSLTNENDSQSAENADAQAKEAYALGKLEETLKIEGELRAENCAAKKMRNEIVGLCSLGEHHIREFAGNTNYNCLIDAVKEFDRVSTVPAPDGINDRGSDEYANPNWNRFKPGGAKGVLDTYRKLHDGKIGMHWLWAVIDRHVAGDDIDEILKDYGYERV